MSSTNQTLAVLVALSLAAFSSDALAQRASTTGGGGSSLFGGAGNSFGGGASGGFGAGSNVAGAGRIGGGAGQGGFGGGAAGGLGQGFGGAQTGGGFVGRDSTEVADFFGALNPLGAQAGGRGTQTRGAMDRGRGVNSEENVRPPVLVRVSVGFKPLPRPLEYRAEQTTTRLNSIITRHGIDGAEIDVVDGVAVLSGSIASESNRRVLTRLARLEPGVSRVEDRTTIIDAESEAVELPAPSAN